MKMKTNAKAWVAAVGATLTAAATAWATVTTTFSDDVVDVTELGSIATAVTVLVGTVFGVWRVENHRDDTE